MYKRQAFTNTIGYPVVLRPAYTLGGSGGGIAYSEPELREILENGLRLSRVGEVLVERCISGWKEIEYEVIRDRAGNCITCLLYTSVYSMIWQLFTVKRQITLSVYFLLLEMKVMRFREYGIFPEPFIII